MKKTVFYVFLGILVCACSSKKEPSVAETSGPVTISFWHSMADDAGLVFESFVKEFNEGPGAEKQINVMPDVMQIDATGIVDYLNTEYAFTVDDALLMDTSYDLKQIMTAPLKAWNYGGRQLGLPVSASTTVMYYNKSLLDSAGVSTPPSSFEEIIEVSRKLPPVNANGHKITAFAQIPNSPYLANWIGQIPGKSGVSSYIVDNRNGRDGEATKLVCDTEGTLLSFLVAWKAMYDAGALLNVSDGINNLFLTQQICFMTASTSQLAALLAQIGGRFELGCAYYPRISQTARYGATVSGSALFMFNRGDKAKTMAAWEFVKFMCSSGIQARFSAATGYMPVNNNSFSEKTYTDYISAYPQAETGARQLAYTSADMMGIVVGPSRSFYMEIMNQVSAMLTEKKSPEDAVKSMSHALNLILEDYATANSYDVKR